MGCSSSKQDFDAGLAASAVPQNTTLSNNSYSQVYYPNAFNDHWKVPYEGAWQAFLYGNRVDAINRINAAIAATRNTAPCEYAHFMVLRCLVDMEFDVFDTPEQFRNLDLDVIPGPFEMEKTVLRMAAWHYQSHGAQVLTLKKFKEAGDDPTQHAKDAWEFYQFMRRSWLQYRVGDNKNTVFSDIQVMVSVLYTHYLTHQNFHAYEQSSAAQDEVRDVQFREWVNVKDLCSYLARQRRFDLSLLIIRLRGLQYHGYIPNEYYIKSNKKEIISALGTIKRSAISTQQVAYARWEFLRHQLERHELTTQEENEERKAIAALFAQGNDPVHEALCLVSGKVALDTIAYQMIPQMKQRLAALGNPFAYALLCSQEIHVYMLFDQRNNFGTVISALWNLENLDTARLGARLHGKSGSASLLYYKIAAWMNTAFINKHDYNEMVLVCYMHSLTKRAPPSIERGAHIFGTLFNAIERRKDPVYGGNFNIPAISRLLDIARQRYENANAMGFFSWNVRDWYYHYGIHDARLTSFSSERIAKLEEIEAEARRQATRLLNLGYRSKVVCAMCYAIEACLYNPKRPSNLKDIDIWNDAVAMEGEEISGSDIRKEMAGYTDGILDLWKNYDFKDRNTFNPPERKWKYLEQYPAHAWTPYERTRLRLEELAHWKQVTGAYGNWEMNVRQCIDGVTAAA